MKQIDKKAFGFLLQSAINKKYPYRTLTAVAEMLDVSKARLSKWVNGQSLPCAAALPSVLEFFDIPMQDFAELPKVRQQRKRQIELDA